MAQDFAGNFLPQLEKKLIESEDLSKLSIEAQVANLVSRASQIVSKEELRKALERSKKTGRPLRVKYGIDPTGSDIHLGHIVPVIVLRRLQQMGHRIIFLIGDFTALVGDPTGQVVTRPMLSPEEIKENEASYVAQVSKFIDVDKAEVRHNSEWLANYFLVDFFRILQSQSVSTVLQREDFRKRESISRAELLYSTLMAIDSLELDAEIELGGQDQLLNFMDTRKIMKSEGRNPEIVITTPILQGVTGDGSKMSKSAHNYIAINDSLDDVYGKVMSIPDSLIEEYFKLLTDISDTDWQALADAMASGVNPKIVKQLLARVLTTLLHDASSAKAAEAKFEEVFSNRQAPGDLPSVELVRSELRGWADLLSRTGMVPSRSEARRLLDSKSIRLVTEGKEKPVSSLDSLPDVNIFVVKVGKRRFVRVTLDRRSVR